MHVCVLIWACRVKVHWAQKEVKEFDAVRHNMQNCDNVAPRMQKMEVAVPCIWQKVWKM